MADTSLTPQQPVFAPEDRIRQLNNIDKVCNMTSPKPSHSNLTQLVSDMIESAGKAIQALANASPNASTLEEHQSIFSDAVSQYFGLLSSVDVQLRRQIYALQEAGLIPEASSKDPQGASFPSVARDKTSTISIGDMVGVTSPLDISWLNSRNDAVGGAIRKELWTDFRHFVGQSQGTEDGSSH